MSGTTRYYDAVTNMHAIMIPVVGAVAIVVGTIAVWLLSKKPEKIRPRLPLIYFLFNVAQLIFPFFLSLTSGGWEIGIQFSLTAMVGIYSFLVFDKEWIKVNAILSLYNVLAILGNIPFLGYSSSLYNILDGSSALASCNSWFDVSNVNESGLCTGYLSFVRVMVFIMIYILATQTFLSYFLYKEFDSFSQLSESSEREKLTGQA